MAMYIDANGNPAPLAIGSISKEYMPSSYRPHDKPTCPECEAADIDDTTICRTCAHARSKKR